MKKETEEEKQELGEDKNVVEDKLPIVKELPGPEDISAFLYQIDLAADILVHAVIQPKKRLENQIEEVEDY